MSLLKNVLIVAQLTTFHWTEHQLFLLSTRANKEINSKRPALRHADVPVFLFDLR